MYERSEVLNYPSDIKPTVIMQFCLMKWDARSFYRVGNPAGTRNK
jgi:hypothetical protein